jgi:hypothetical protein
MIFLEKFVVFVTLLLYQVKTQKSSLFKDKKFREGGRLGMLCKAQGGKAGWFLPAQTVQLN